MDNDCLCTIPVAVEQLIGMLAIAGQLCSLAAHKISENLTIGSPELVGASSRKYLFGSEPKHVYYSLKNQQKRHCHILATNDGEVSSLFRRRTN